MSGVVEDKLSWEHVAEDFSFVFYACDLKGRINFVNRAWHDAIEHEAVPQFLSHCAPNRNLFDAFGKADVDRFLHPIESLRLGHVPHFEEIVPCHAPNQYRWTLMRMQRFGDEIIFNYYFLRHYSPERPLAPKIRCLLDSGSWAKSWAYDDSPLDEETALALCPNCALHLYSFLRHE